MGTATLMTLSANPMPKTAAALPRQSWPLPCLLPALGSSLLLWLCYFPMAWGCLGWVALVPLLLLVRSSARTRNIFLASYAGGIFFFFPALFWMTVADYRMFATWAALSVYCSLYFPTALFIMRRLDRATHWPLIVTVPIVWTALEFIRSFLLTGFAWYYLGHTQHRYLAVIQIADLGGVYAVTLLVAMANAWIVECLLRLPALRQALRLSGPPNGDDYRLERWPIPLGQGAVLVGLSLATLVYGGVRLNQESPRIGPTVALLQGNLDQRLRNEAAQGSKNSVADVAKHYADLCTIALQAQPDLIVWPETSYPHPWLESSSKLKISQIPPLFFEDESYIQKHLRELARGEFSSAKTRANHLFGINTLTLDDNVKEKRWNSALLIYDDGNIGGRYDKIHRVPFGEYVPLMDWLPFLSKFAPYDFDYSISMGEKMTRLALKTKKETYHFGVLICYEDTDPFLARQYGREQPDGPPVDFLVNISNDGWFDGSAEHEEHLAISRFRAIECRRSLCRSVNMGISAVIDSNGRVQKPDEYRTYQSGKLWVVRIDEGGAADLPDGAWSDFKKTPGVIYATIPIDNRMSLYSYLGDWLPVGCWAAIFGTIVWSWARRLFLGVA